MIKAPRFMREFLKYQIKTVKELGLDIDGNGDIEKSLRRVVERYEQGIITLSEAMDLLNNI